MATEEITISELELADEVLADMTLPVDTATETRAVTLKQLRAWLGSALPIGSIFASVGRLDDERFTLLDGKTISRIGTYEAFCNKVVEKVQAGTWKACTEEDFNLEVSETGQCGKFVVSNDYVRIPKLGNSLCSGVIDGTIAVVGNGMTLGWTNGTQTGGMRLSGTTNQATIESNLYGTQVGTANTTANAITRDVSVGITTDPTKSGIEAKINSVEVFYYMVISTEGQTASVEIDINKVYEDLNLKANSDLSNVASVASSFKEQSVGWGMPDFDAGVSIELNVDIVAPYPCFVTAEAKSNTSQLSAITLSAKDINNTYRPVGVSYSIVSGYSSSAVVSGYFAKGQTFKCSKTSGSSYSAIMYPLKGVN